MKTRQLYLYLLLFAVGFSVSAQNPFTEMLNNPQTRAIIDADIPTRDQVILDDLIVVGSACVGQDCVNGESFGFDTFRMKENNLRMHFDDTSTSASFPKNDWRFTFNDSANGGASYFSVDDATAGRSIFKVEAGAPANSLYVESDGDIGIGTNNPVVELHVADGDTPTMRLEQNGSSGFTAQTWDVAGNETNFFIRDVSNGSKLPFKIRPNAATGTMVLGAQANVGIGVGGGNPDSNASLDLKSTTQGLLINRLDTAQRDALALSLDNSNDVGMMVMDQSLKELWVWDGAAWKRGDNQKVNVFNLSGSDLQLSLTHDDDPTHEVSLNVFRQNLDVLTLTGTTLNISHSNDNAATQSVDLASLVAPFQSQIDRQQAIIDGQQAQINDLISRMEAKEACGCYEGQTSPRSEGQSGIGDSNAMNDRAYLSQNIPNPFDNTTTIGYFVPFVYSEANIVISNTIGQILENRKIDKFGKGAIIVNKDRMQASIYYYSLFVDGKKIDTKRMVVD